MSATAMPSRLMTTVRGTTFLAEDQPRVAGSWRVTEQGAAVRDRAAVSFERPRRTATSAASGSRGLPERRDGPLHQRARAAAGVLRGVDWSTRAREWVGSRPITSDGIPLVGSTRIDGVYTAGGHGMWGATQGPATGMLLARQIATGEPASELLALGPLR
ncbi:FAD-dependent oxidoreductase [Dactylosporangium sp. CA-152071]|uniref:FAD-dependent oxidoreductase n=1 Tax=Dactylosporangium sp. CA-152071 TaxID=3239933 RepID=UPI003D92F0EE